jgi:hypothetical protein
MLECKAHVIDMYFQVNGIARAHLSADQEQQGMQNYLRYKWLGQARLEVAEAA